jgi:hypothetical protein
MAANTNTNERDYETPEISDMDAYLGYHGICITSISYCDEL